MPEDPIIQTLIKGGTTFGLLAFLVYAIVGLIRLLVEHLTRMAEALVKTNADLAAALRDLERWRAEQAREHQEQSILLKLVLDKVSEKDRDG